MTRAALMQPQFLPWLGYLELLAESDVFVALDDFQLQRRSWQTRNRVVFPGGAVKFLTLPIRADASYQPMNEAVPAVDDDWIASATRTLTMSYGKAPHGSEILGLLESWWSAPHRSVADMELALLGRVATELGITTPIVRSSDLTGVAGARSERLQSILRAVGADTYLCAASSASYMHEDAGWDEFQVLLQDHEPKEYPQVGLSEFVPRLAFVDAVANVGWSRTAGLLDGTVEWLPFSSVEPVA